VVGQPSEQLWFNQREIDGERDHRAVVSICAQRCLACTETSQRTETRRIFSCEGKVADTGTHLDDRNAHRSKDARAAVSQPLIASQDLVLRPAEPRARTTGEQKAADSHA
jgi:hypothetical protein